MEPATEARTAALQIPDGVEIEYVAAPIVLEGASAEFAESFANVVTRFTVTEGEEDAQMADATEEPADDHSMGSDDEDDPAAAKLSKKKHKKQTQLTVAQLKQFAGRPEVVEWEDMTSKDPRLLVQLKSVKSSVPVPGHWSRKRKYLAGKRGFVKPPFELPQFIKDTGVLELREAARHKDETKKQKVKAREKMHPKLGKISVDYVKLHEAFFKYQTKPLLTGHGDLYYEGKEFEGRSRDARPGFLSEELRTALGMGALNPPTWLHNIQKYGPPPAYPHMRIPGYNAAIPEGAQWGFHPGGWGKPPADAPAVAYGSASGPRPDVSAIKLLLEPVDRNIWGELEPDAEDTWASYELEPDAERDVAHNISEMTLDGEEAEAHHQSRAVPEARHEHTPVVSLEGPESLELRKSRRR